MSLPALPVTLSIRFCSNSCSFCLIKNTINVLKSEHRFFYKMLINADVVKVVPEVLYIAMIDSLRQQFYPRMKKQAEKETSQTAI